MKKLSILFIIIGLVLISVGGYQYIKTKAAEKDSLKEAKLLLENSQSSNSGDKVYLPDGFFEPEFGDAVGILGIPSIDAELPIIEGTDPDDLAKGVGHFKGSAYPQENDQIVLSGHRDTVFRNLGEVQVGDVFVVKLPYGEFNYEMVSSKIVDADDRTVIKSTAPNEELVITTCYPFNFVGNAPERYVIYAKPLSPVASVTN